MVPLQSLVPAEIRTERSPSFRNQLAFKNVALVITARRGKEKHLESVGVIQAGFSGKCLNPVHLEGLGNLVELL